MFNKKMDILISAYACSPYHGSEPGMGWNFISNLSEYHNLHVITEKREFQDDIEQFLSRNPKYSRIKFHYISRQHNEWLRKIWPPSYYWYYKDWQRKAFQLAKELDKKEDFDLVHQLNMVGFREPGYLWKMDKPFVWGPIGGLENSSWRFLPSLGFKGLVFYTGRNIYNTIQRRFLKRPQKAAQRENTRLIAATPSNKEWIKKLWGVEPKVMCEVGQEQTSETVTFTKRVTENETLKIVWSGLHTPRKNLPLLFDALEQADYPFELHILGDGEMTNKWKEKAAKSKIQEQCRWYGWVEREKALEVINEGHVFAITSIYDLTSTVTLEALSYGLPIVCLDHCGFAHVVNDQCGIKIPVETPRQVAADFNRALKRLAGDEAFRQKLAKGAIGRANDFNWNKKIEQLNLIYRELLEEDKQVHV